jgi:hypothetical protein
MSSRLESGALTPLPGQTYEARVRELEEVGCTTSDAQSVADCEVDGGKLAPPNGDYVLDAAMKRIYRESISDGGTV